MHSLFILLCLVTPLLANPVPEPTPPALLEDRAVCDQDNCLRALSSHATSASPYCSSYTKATQTATTGFPTFVPSTCGPSRVSSACSCLVPPPSTSITTNTTTPISSTSAASQCTHTGQVVSNPSFYGDEGPWGYDTQLEPWVISHVSGSGPGCYLGPNGYSVADGYDGFGDPGYVTCNFNNTVGQDTVSIDVNMCPGMNYTFLAHTACDYYQYGQGAVEMHFVVHFNGKTIVPSTRACVPCKDYCIGGGDTYDPVTANVTGPASGRATIQFVVTGAAAPDGGFVLPFLMDIITLTAAGYTGPPYVTD